MASPHPKKGKRMGDLRATTLRATGATPPSTVSKLQQNVARYNRRLSIQCETEPSPEHPVTGIRGSSDRGPKVKSQWGHGQAGLGLRGDPLAGRRPYAFASCASDGGAELQAGRWRANCRFYPSRRDGRDRDDTRPRTCVCDRSDPLAYLRSEEQGAATDPKVVRRRSVAELMPTSQHHACAFQGRKGTLPSVCIPAGAADCAKASWTSPPEPGGRGGRGALVVTASSGLTGRCKQRSAGKASW